jgi:hypothetical protein
MSATPIAQPTTGSISLATLRAVLAKGQAAHPELAVRMQRAADIVAFRRISPAVAPENVGRCYWVESSDGSQEYWVTQDARGDYRHDRCTCPDSQQRGSPCKHSIAVRLLAACERTESKRAPQRTAWGSDVDAAIPYLLTGKALATLAAPEPTPAA